MFHNQFVASTQDFELNKRGQKFRFNKFFVWSDATLETTHVISNDVNLILFGFILDPRDAKKSNQQILEVLSGLKFLSKEFFNEINVLTGRFVLLMEYDNQCIILNDPAAQRQVYFHVFDEGIHFGSSPKLIYEINNIEFVIPPSKKKIIESNRFKVLEQWFPGDAYMDENLKRLLPNFYLNLCDNNVYRIPVDFHSYDKSQIKQNLTQMISGSLEACANRFQKVMFAITAGSDSRLLLNFSPSRSNIFYFLYKRNNENDVDHRIAQKLAQKKDLNLNTIEPQNVSVTFLDEFKNQFLYPRILSKLKNISYLKNNYANSNTVVIAGYAGELLRNSTNSINPYHKNFNSAKDFVDYLNYPPNEYLELSMNSWVKSTGEYLKDSKNLTLLDLFHWEHHMAPYCALYSYEQDFSNVEIFCPLANRQMIFDLIHNTTAEERSFPNGIIYDLIYDKSPEWNQIPYNPKPLIKKIKHELFKRLPISIVNKIINR